jgi:tRNA-dihydrouridine synthase
MAKMVKRWYLARSSILTKSKRKAKELQKELKDKGYKSVTIHKRTLRDRGDGTTRKGYWVKKLTKARKK